MASNSPRRPRRYVSVVRTEQARLTRQRVLGAARRLFLDGGFSGTAVQAVAAEAGVSPEMIYATFENKRGLLVALIDESITGPGSPVPLEEQGDWEAIARRPTPRARLRAYVEFSCGVLARTSAIHVVIRSAADREPFAVELSERLLRERLASNLKRLKEYVGSELRAGITLRRAAERYCALTSPELHHLLTAKLGWSPRVHQEWVAALVEHDLLEPP